MTETAQFDRNTLATVKPGLDSTLAEISGLLVQFLADPIEGKTFLEKAQTELHSLLGVLTMVRLDGAAIFCAELATALNNAFEHPEKVSDAYRIAIRQSLFGITHYLDALSNGADNAALRLFPQYQQLQKLRGIESSRELDLFYPRLDVAIPEYVVAQSKIIGAAIDNRESGLHSILFQYQQSMLHWLRHEDTKGSLRNMQKAVEEVMAYVIPSDQNFWWVASAFLEGLHLGLIEPSHDVHKIVGRIDQHLRTLSKEKTDDVKPVLYEMLYLIGRSVPEPLIDVLETNPDAESSLSAIKKHYLLEEYLPQTSRLPLGEVEQHLETMRDRLLAAEESWELCVRGNKGAAELFLQQVGQLVSLSSAMDRDALVYLAEQIQELSQNIHLPDHLKLISIDMAMALLLLGSGIDNYNRLGSGFQEQARILIERMQNAVKQQPQDKKRLDELVTLHYKLEQRGDIMAPMAKEMLINLQQVEQGLNLFFGDPSRRGGLAELLRLLAQIQGGFSISSLSQAEQLLSLVQHRVRMFSRNNAPLRAAERYALADALSALENYMQHLTHGQSGDVWRLEDAKAEMLRLDHTGESASPPEELNPLPPPSPLISVKVSPPERDDEKGTIVMQQRIEQSSITVKGGLRLDDPLLNQSASDPKVNSLKTDSLKTDSLKTDSLKGIKMPDLIPAQTFPDIQKVSPIEPTLSEEELELLGIFLEEAHGVIEAIRSHLETCRANPLNYESFVAIRRGFHTLKGSGRMVGLDKLGEVAWSIEKALNQWLQKKQPGTPDVFSLIHNAEQFFSRWIHLLEQDGTATMEDPELVMAAERVENGNATQGPPEPSLGATFVAFEPGNPIATEEMPHTLRPAQAAHIHTQSETPLFKMEDQETASPDPELVEIANAESRQNTITLREQFERMRTSSIPQIDPEFLRAAHTLVGVNQALDHFLASEMSILLEKWLNARMGTSFLLSDVQEQMLDQTILILESISCGLSDPDIDGMIAPLNIQLSEDQHPANGQHPDKGVEKIIYKESAEVDSRCPEPHLVESGIFTSGEPHTLVSSKQTTSVQPVLAQPEKMEMPQVKLRESSVGLESGVTGGQASSFTAEIPTAHDELDDQLVPVFLEEAEDLIPKVGAALNLWKESPQDEKQVQSLKRLLHTLKGSSRMVGAMRIGETSHLMEDYVANAPRDAGDYWSVLDGHFDKILALINELKGGEPVAEPEPNPIFPDLTVAKRRSSDNPIGVERRVDWRGDPSIGNMLRVRSDVIDRLVNEAGEISVIRSRVETEMRVFKDGLLDLTASVLRLRQQLREVEIQAESQIQARLSIAQDQLENFDPLEFDRFTRLQELTRFMNESVHDVQTVQQSLLRRVDETGISLSTQGRLNRELQQGLMNVRMVSFNSITDRLYRIVRQTGKELNKKVNLELNGTNVELDRSVLEKMVAPLEHLLRNSIVHGLESDAVRAQHGKLPIGEIRLSVYQENNEVVFDFRDDGAGLNFAKLRQKAVSLGTIKEHDSVSENQLIELIFTPGLSTAEHITEIAGRGIGMDVVRSEIASLGGRIDVRSKAGSGTQFMIHLPLTLAVTKVLKIRCGTIVYAVSSALVEHVRQVKSKELQALHQAKTVEWEGHSYPFYSLHHLLGKPGLPPQNPRNQILLLRSGEQRIAFYGDELLGHQEVMVKNIGAQLSRVIGIAGATILGDGKILLILNPLQLAQHIRSSFGFFDEPGQDEKQQSPMEELAQAGSPSLETMIDTRPLIMVVDDSLTVRKITSRMLVRAGYQVVTAMDGVDALEKLENVTPQVMLLDIEMPRMDGFALARQLRRDPKTFHLPIIMITSRTADKHREYAMQLGVNTYLGKPYQEDALLQNIADFVADHKFSV